MFRNSRYSHMKKTSFRFRVVVYTAGFPRHKNNAAAGEDVATIPALRKGDLTTLHNCKNSTATNTV